MLLTIKEDGFYYLKRALQKGILAKLHEDIKFESVIIIAWCAPSVVSAMAL